jgi:hypothetical protein
MMVALAHPQPVGLPGLIVLMIGLAAFAAALLAARIRRGGGGTTAQRSRRSMIGIGLQALALGIVGFGPVYARLPA